MGGDIDFKLIKELSSLNVNRLKYVTKSHASLNNCMY